VYIALGDARMKNDKTVMIKGVRKVVAFIRRKNNKKIQITGKVKVKK
jgi:uncharacterized protein YbcV (DUF1398 family)